jgi:hypothetical protein
MSSLTAHGLELSPPIGIEARIYRRSAPYGATAYPVLQASSVPIEPRVGDFGSGLVETMGSDDIFLTLFQYAPENLDKALFATRGLPRALNPSAFGTWNLKRPMHGQGGCQRFFSEAGRPFTLYVVLGSFASRSRLLPRVNAILRTIVVQPVEATS